jgi:predicted permease
MGKDKGANRTKNQSSSSAQAAALIQNTGFVGFSGRVPGGSLHVVRNNYNEEQLLLFE